ncbi:hypothetical protein ACU19_04790 [Actinobaculum suis]|uniref:hypothetical protein n=1 Tax=Actinobaculum suis TaxID=1657 RepID=UPI00066FCA74|nr:hypothetical protein [Actinobaculum suis]KMY23296.1 hypothetical protein ACU19_04790 [Actinobaculum suis]
MSDQIEITSVEQALGIVALGKFAEKAALTAEAKTLVKRARFYLEAHMNPGDRRVVGDDLATVSRNKMSEKYVIRDEKAFGDWLEEERKVPDVWKLSVRDTFTSAAYLASLKTSLDAEGNGEIPPGVEIEESGGYVTSRLSDKQMKNMEAAVESARRLNAAWSAFNAEFRAVESNTENDEPSEEGETE